MPDAFASDQLTIWAGEHGGELGRQAGLRNNAKRSLTCADVRVTRLYETRDPFDRAHAVSTLMVVRESRLAEVGVMPAARRTRGGGVALNVASSKPRLYPRSQMTSQGVSFDSAYDRTEEIRRELLRAGLDDLAPSADPFSVRAKAGAGGGLRERTRR